MINELLFLSKNDIPFTQAQVNIHQPTIKEISLISEESFRIGSQFLNFSIKDLPHKDKINLTDKTDFEVFMSMMNSKERAKYKTDTLLVLTLLFPNHRIKVDVDKILLQSDTISSSINFLNYEAFKEIITEMFCLKVTKQEEGGYNPADAFAERIANKLKKRHEVLAKNKGEEQKLSIFEKYISILAVGEHKDINDLMNYTVYQLMNEFKRFQAKESFDFYMKAKLAGAKDLEEVDNWMN